MHLKKFQVSTSNLTQLALRYLTRAPDSEPVTLETAAFCKKKSDRNNVSRAKEPYEELAELLGGVSIVSVQQKVVSFTAVTKRAISQKTWRPGEAVTAALFPHGDQRKTLKSLHSERDMRHQVLISAQCFLSFLSLSFSGRLEPLSSAKK